MTEPMPCPECDQIVPKGFFGDECPICKLPPDIYRMEDYNSLRCPHLEIVDHGKTMTHAQLVALWNERVRKILNLKNKKENV